MLHWEERQMGWGAEGAEPSRVQAVSRLSQLTPLVPKAGLRLRLRLRARGRARPLRRCRSVPPPPSLHSTAVHRSGALYKERRRVLA